MDPIVSIIYVNYNTSVLLIDSMQSVEKHCTDIPYEIIIVDNASVTEEKNKLTIWVQQKSADNLKVIWSDINLGFGRANNSGANHASGNYLFFLNPDTLIVNNVIKLFCDFMKSAPGNIAACGGNLLKPDLSANDSYGNFPGLLLELCNVGLGLRFLFNRHYKENIAIASIVRSKEIQKVPYIVGAAIFIKSVYFKQVSGFDDKYFLYYEETDLFKKLAVRGLDTYLLPEAKIIHTEGGSVGKDTIHAYNYLKFKMLLTSKRYYYKKWFGSYFLAFLEPILLMQILVQYSKGKMGKNFGKLLAMYFK